LLNTSTWSKFSSQSNGKIFGINNCEEEEVALIVRFRRAGWRGLGSLITSAIPGFGEKYSLENQARQYILLGMFKYLTIDLRQVVIETSRVKTLGLAFFSTEIML